MNPAVIPILPSPDADATARFYSKLGFAEVARFPNEYLILEHSVGIELHFFKSDELVPASNDHGCYIRFESAAEAADLYELWSRVEMEDGELHPPTEATYGLLEFALLDGHRNLLRVGGVIGQ